MKYYKHRSNQEHIKDNKFCITFHEYINPRYLDSRTFLPWKVKGKNFTNIKKKFTKTKNT